MVENKTKKLPEDMSSAELQEEIGNLEMILHFKLCGDPRDRVTVPIVVNHIVDTSRAPDNGEWTQSNYRG